MTSTKVATLLELHWPVFAAICHFFCILLLIFHVFWGWDGVRCCISVRFMLRSSSGTCIVRSADKRPRHAVGAGDWRGGLTGAVWQDTATTAGRRSGMVAHVAPRRSAGEAGKLPPRCLGPLTAEAFARPPRHRTFFQGCESVRWNSWTQPSGKRML